jgi:hypothetical protein
MVAGIPFITSSTFLIAIKEENMGGTHRRMSTCRKPNTTKKMNSKSKNFRNLEKIFFFLLGLDFFLGLTIFFFDTFMFKFSHLTFYVILVFTKITDHIFIIGS